MATVSSTQARIVSAAKQMFRQNGYTGMHVSDLSKELGISKGNLTYYFSTKDALIRYLFTEYHENINRYIDKAGLPVEHFYSRQLYFSLINDINILSDPQICSFYETLLNTPVQLDILRNVCLSQVRLLHDNNCVVASPTDLEYYAEALVGAYNALDRMFISKDIHDSESIFQHAAIKQMSRAQLWTVRRPNFDVRDTTDSIARHINTLKSVDFSNILLL